MLLSKLKKNINLKKLSSPGNEAIWLKVQFKDALTVSYHVQQTTLT